MTNREGRERALELELDRDRFLKNLRCARRGAAAGSSGLISEHLRPILDSARDSELLWKFGQSFARGQVLAEILPLVRLGRVTALRKPSGGIRGIVVGDVFRRLARTIAQQINPAVEQATAPFQYVLTTRAGVECVAHVIQFLTDLDQQATVLSVDGVGAFDLISRAEIIQGDGAEKGDPLMPAPLRSGPAQSLGRHQRRHLCRVSSGARGPHSHLDEGTVMTSRPDSNPPRQNSGLEPGSDGARQH